MFGRHTSCSTLSLLRPKLDWGAYTLVLREHTSRAHSVWFWALSWIIPAKGQRVNPRRAFHWVRSVQKVISSFLAVQFEAIRWNKWGKKVLFRDGMSKNECEDGGSGWWKVPRCHLRTLYGRLMDVASRIGSGRRDVMPAAGGARRTTWRIDTSGSAPSCASGLR